MITDNKLIMWPNYRLQMTRKKLQKKICNLTLKLRASSAADTGETSKKLKYKSLAQDYHFTPIAIETYGAWGTESHKIIKEIGQNLMETTGEKKSTFFLTQWISIALMRGNAACILGTVPPTEGLEAIFDFIDHEGKPQ